MNTEQLLAQISELSRIIQQQQQQIEQLQKAIGTQPQKTEANLAIPRKYFLKGLAASLFAGVAGASGATLFTGEKVAQAKITISNNQNVGTVSTLAGVAAAGAVVNTDNKYGLVASANPSFNLNELPVEASTGVFGTVSSGAGIWGKVNDGYGIRGEVGTFGFGVSGTAAADGTGVGGASISGFGVAAQSMSGIPLFIQPVETAPIIPQGTTAGGLYINAAGDLFTLKNGVWKKLVTEA